MVRLSDLNDVEAEHMRMRAREMHPVAPAPWITPKALKDCTVAIISTAGLHRRGDAPFKVGAIDYRLIPGDAEFSDLVVSHISTNFDRSAYQEDPNIWFPLDRLREMTADGEIGGVSSWHYTFMGAQPNHEALSAAGEEVGRLLAEDEVDLALLVPVWPICTGAVGALGNYIERAGVATVSISLIREQTEAVRPPRALWVPFALGRPLGVAGDPGFQKEVLRASFAMLESAVEPTIEDYPIEAPLESGTGEWSCPVNFAVAMDDSISARLLAEINLMAPWSAETRATRGRTLFGVTGVEPDQVELVAKAVGEIADQGNVSDLPAADVTWQFEMPLLIRHLVDDLRTFYHEAVAAQPGDNVPNHEALNDWIFGGTALGDAIQAIAQHLTRAGDVGSLMTRGFLVPEGYLEGGGSAFPTPAEVKKTQRP